MKRALRMLVLCLLVTPATGFANSPKDLAHADFTADQTSGCSSFIVQFTDQSVAPANDPITQYKWIFGDGSESDEVNPAHQFLSAGIFNIKLVITSQSGWKDSVTRMNYIQVNPSPIVNIGADTVVCDGSIMFLDAGNPGATYQWNTGDMFQEIQAYWAGEYWVEVTANGCSTRDTILIFSVPGLYADYTQTESEGCLPSTVTFQNLSSTCGGTLTETYWDFGDGTSS
ncbi:MAG TPA: PKD domain-containing protein, partial [Flavitalea sp.]|nr:PKD domain-containing protein [Flavitalea sp.]